LLVISEEGELEIGAASPKGFEPDCRLQVFEEGPCWITPTLANGLIYVRNAKGRAGLLGSPQAALANRLGLLWHPELGHFAPARARE